MGTKGAAPKKEKHSRFGSVTNLFFSKLKGSESAKKKKAKKLKNGKNGKNAKSKKAAKYQVFGVDPRSLESAQCDGYAVPIPLVLTKMKAELFMNDGHLIEGIFRVAPNATTCKEVEDAMNGGAASMESIDWASAGGAVIANLIKIWFRLLPQPVLDGIESGKIERVQQTQSVDDAESVVMDELAEPQRTYFLWLIDLCIDITAHDAVNKMTPKNMAVVVAPNLYDPAAITDPMKAMTLSQAIVQFVQITIEWRTRSAEQ